MIVSTDEMACYLKLKTKSKRIVIVSNKDGMWIVGNSTSPVTEITKLVGKLLKPYLSETNLKNITGTWPITMTEMQYQILSLVVASNVFSMYFSRKIAITGLKLTKKNFAIEYDVNKEERCNDSIPKIIKKLLQLKRIVDLTPGYPAATEINWLKDVNLLVYNDLALNLDQYSYKLVKRRIILTKEKLQRLFKEIMGFARKTHKA